MALSDSLGMMSASNVAPNTDTTNIPPSIKMMMLKRKMEKKDDTPKWSKEDMIEGIKKGFKGMTQQERDSIASKFDHQAYLKHLDEVGMEVVKKKNM